MLLAKYIAVKSGGSPYWEQVDCGNRLLDKLRSAESPNTLAELLLSETGAARLLRASPDAGARQAADECLQLFFRNHFLP